MSINIKIKLLGAVSISDREEEINKHWRATRGSRVELIDRHTRRAPVSISETVLRQGRRTQTRVMADSIYTHDFLLDPGVEIKLESPLELSSMSASVPIPQRRADFDDFGNELDLCLQDNLTGSFHNVPNMQYNKLTYEADNSSKMDTFRMDDDDIFQVDKADLILGPTLAELNANPDTLLDDLNFDDLLLPEESGYCVQIGGAMSGTRRTPMQTSNTLAPESPCSPYSRTQHTFSPSSQHSSASSSFAQPMNQLPELLMRMDSYSGEIALGQSVPASTVLPPFLTSMKPQHTQLSSSAPTHLTMEQVGFIFIK